MEYGRAMGADPTPVALAEAYMALQQNVVDGLENPLSSIYNMKFHEVQKYINLTSHVTNANFFLMNAKVYNGLAKEYQDILMGAFDEASKLIVKILNEDDKKLGETFKQAGVTVHQPDLEAFKKATATMPEKFRKWWFRYGEDLHSRIQNIK
jgi:TRAP-type C4-dicarboxylate transport system substrate-binding protein